MLGKTADNRGKHRNLLIKSVYLGDLSSSNINTGKRAKA